MQKLLTSITLCLTLGFIASCGGNLKTLEVESPELDMTAEGPLFEGANTATATWEFNLSDILGEEGTQVSKAKVKAIEVTFVELEDSPSLEKMVFEVTSQNTSMTRVGLYESGLAPGNKVELSVAGKQENLASAFKDEKMTFVGDFDLLEEEYWDNLSFKVKVKFEISVKQ
ncbi:hypothetical protein A33Q_1592 [Indibacter alkaliphilus LW1]|jgi:hypothetical protein|uniref:YceI-like domain-containing protein n=1 Tax=Indibacter alkaliphilus (strain CCUG 57479 / KCTC 22604 / LW1) TaxID=1189612 RepID=S2DL45_INDAL|nr:hypothetical protein [Indibacter alkaliphilus]EOZ97940.1 hypothetical protein A33Q_1592 [Indibacter alkaliphilus LW1]